MMTKKISGTNYILLSLLTVVLFQTSGKTSEVRAAEDRTRQGVRSSDRTETRLPCQMG